MPVRLGPLLLGLELFGVAGLDLLALARLEELQNPGFRSSCRTARIQINLRPSQSAFGDHS